jgi:hypothetical protein
VIKFLFFDYQEIQCVGGLTRRVHQAQLEGGGGHMPVEELRGIAETRTASFGREARFASSLLLLLAVLGTFAGVKTALPSLIDTIAADPYRADKNAVLIQRYAAREDLNSIRQRGN